MRVNLNVLKALCLKGEKKVKTYLKEIIPGIEDYGTFLLKEDEGNKVLGVAHMDVVPLPSSFKTKTTTKDILVFSPALDDRLGIYVMSHLLPQFKMPMDILITRDEESNASTGADFARECNKDYNWIIEFDRMGTDVVLYDYDTNLELISDLKSVGFRIGVGSYSDICVMEELGVSAFNMGIGYHFQHSVNCWASLMDLQSQLKKLKCFYDTFVETSYVHIPDPGNKWMSIWDERDMAWNARDGVWDDGDLIHYLDSKYETPHSGYPNKKDFKRDNFLWDYGSIYEAQIAQAQLRRKYSY